MFLIRKNPLTNEKKKSNFEEQNQIPRINNFKQTHFLPTHIEKSLQKPMNHKRERERERERENKILNIIFQQN
jgi:hypothetical protein